MKIAITGFRGIPSNYGGFETFIEEMAPRLAKRGHQIVVYGRSNTINYNEKYYNGVEIVLLPTISHKYLDTVFHTFLALCHISIRKFDVVFVMNAANSPLLIIPRLFGKKTALNVDGIERLRKKWGILGRMYYLFGEFFATILPNEIVSDAKVIEEYYYDKYGAKSTMIPYGAEVKKPETTVILDKFNVKPGEYILYVSRLEPENNADKVIEAFKQLKTDKKLVIVGDAPYAAEYKQKLKELVKNDNRIIFTGFIFGTGYKEFQSNAYCYVQATEVGGTHPALIEAMAAGNCVVANGTQENIEVLSDAGLIYKKNDIKDLKEKLQYVLDNPDKINLLKEKAKKIVNEKYSWDTVTESYEKLFQRMLK